MKGCKVKLLAFDLDGTALVKHSILSEPNRQALMAAAERGVILVPATGRMRDFLPWEITALPVTYAITSNGGAVYDLKSGEAVVERLIPNETAIAVQEILNGYDIYIEYYTGGRAITRRDMPEMARTYFGLPESKWGFVDGKVYTLTDDLGRMLMETGLCPEKINLPFLRPDQRQEIWQRLEAMGGLLLTSSILDNIEINAASAHKGEALRALGEQLGFEPEEIMAIGDNCNDVTMLETAGVSVAMGDGADEAKAAAKYITAAHDQDGLAKAIQELILS